MKKVNTFLLIFILAVTALLSSCKKYEEEVVKDNIAPPDETVSVTAIENYVNKTYISLLGREPDSLELVSGIAALKTHNVSAADRDVFLNAVLVESDYSSHLFNISNIDLLNNLDTNEFTAKILLFQFLLTDSTYVTFWSTLQYELDRVIIIQQIAANLQNGTSGIIDLHHTFTDNYFYDQINMGSLNFVVSMYQNFLRRYPTVNELNAGIAMVDGNYAIVFGQSGHLKTDFTDIFFSSNDYYEGQVRDLYLRYLFREPTSIESSTLTIQYKSSGNYKQLQKAILSTNEFIGI